MAGPYNEIYYYLNKYLFRLLPDKLYHNLLGYIMHQRFRCKFYWMNIEHPVTFSEKLQWIKKNAQSDEKSVLADKYEVREWVKKTIGSKYLIDLIPLNSSGILAVETIEEIDFNSLPDQFALKLTKGSGYNIICNNKDALDLQKTKKLLSKWLSINNYYLSREPQYRGKNKIICEKLLKYNITDYKFFCFNGIPEYVELYMDRFGNHKKIFYDMNWEKAGFTTANDFTDIDVECPSEFNEMINLAKLLSQGWAFVRVDLYLHNGKIYFGEMTFHPAGGYTPITPHGWEFKLGEKINL